MTNLAERHTDLRGHPFHTYDERIYCLICTPREEKSMKEAVHHPDHYGGEGNPYEAIKVIEAWGAGFNTGNALKYIRRAESKGAEQEDYQKACWYLLRELAKHEGRDPGFYNDLLKKARTNGGVRSDDAPGPQFRLPIDVWRDLVRRARAQAIQDVIGVINKHEGVIGNSESLEGKLLGLQDILMDPPRLRRCAWGKTPCTNQVSMKCAGCKQWRCRNHLTTGNKGYVCVGKCYLAVGGGRAVRITGKPVEALDPNAPPTPGLKALVESGFKWESAERAARAQEIVDMKESYSTTIAELEKRLASAEARLFTACKKGRHLWGIAPTTETPCANCRKCPGGAGVVHACDDCGEPLGQDEDAGSLAFTGVRYYGARHFKCRPSPDAAEAAALGSVTQELRGKVADLEVKLVEARAKAHRMDLDQAVKLEQAAKILAPAGDVDCAKRPDEPSDYAKRLEKELQRLGLGMEKLGIKPCEGGEKCVDAALRALDARLTGLQTEHQLRVERMMRGFGQKVLDRPGIRDPETRVLRARLIMEECFETVVKGLRVEAAHNCGGVVNFDNLCFEAEAGPPDLVELADGCADISVVTIGTLSSFGIKDAALLREVDKNNQVKIDTGKTDEHGKWVKHPDHQGPNVGGVLRAQGYVEQHPF